MNRRASRGSDRQSKAASLYRRVGDLKKRMTRGLSKSGPTGEDVLKYRSQLREIYVKLLFEEPQFSSVKEVLGELWKVLDYSFIQKFRSQLKNISSSDPDRREKRSTVRRNFQNFLKVSVDDYSEIEKKLQEQKRCMEQYVDDNNEGNDEDQIRFRRRILRFTTKSLQRVYIYLGDLCRYMELHTREKQPSRTRDMTMKQRKAMYDFSLARRYYFNALKTVAANGTSHNQLAVLAHYEKDDLEALYRYFRSLYLPKPFRLAKGNINLILETNRRKLIDLTQRKMKPPGGKNNNKKKRRAQRQEKRIPPKRRGVYDSKFDEQQQKSRDNLMDVHEMYERMLMLFLRMIGMLYTRTDIESFKDVQAKWTQLFDVLLTNDVEREYMTEENIRKFTVITIVAIETSGEYRNVSEKLLYHALEFAFVFQKLIADYSIDNMLMYVDSLGIFIRFISQRVELLSTLEKHDDNKMSEFFTIFIQLLNRTMHLNVKDTSVYLLAEDVELRGFTLFENSSSENEKKRDGYRSAAQLEEKIRVARIREMSTVFLGYCLYLNRDNTEYSIKPQIEPQQFLFNDDDDDDESDDEDKMQIDQPKVKKVVKEDDGDVVMHGKGESQEEEEDAERFIDNNEYQDSYLLEKHRRAMEEKKGNFDDDEDDELNEFFDGIDEQDDDVLTPPPRNPDNAVVFDDEKDVVMSDKKNPSPDEEDDEDEKMEEIGSGNSAKTGTPNPFLGASGFGMFGGGRPPVGEQEKMNEPKPTIPLFENQPNEEDGQGSPKNEDFFLFGGGGGGGGGRGSVGQNQQNNPITSPFGFSRTNEIWGGGENFVTVFLDPKKRGNQGNNNNNDNNTQNSFGGSWDPQPPVEQKKTPPQKSSMTYSNPFGAGLSSTNPFVQTTTTTTQNEAKKDVHVESNEEEEYSSTIQKLFGTRKKTD